VKLPPVVKSFYARRYYAAAAAAGVGNQGGV
jgi:hypothetical protein